MKKLFYLLLFTILPLNIWLCKDAHFISKSHSEIERIESSLFANAILIPNSDIEGVFLYLVFPSGEAQNTFDEGLAHYVEHIAWLSAFAGALGENTRHSNAWTNHFSTGYWHKTVGDDLYSALQNLISVSSPFNVDSGFALEERNIVLREYDFRITERPLYPVYRHMDRSLYGEGALARSIIGEPEVIAEYSLAAAASLHKKSHILSNATLLVYGNVSKALLEAAAASLSVEDAYLPPESLALPQLVEDGVVQDRTPVSLPQLSEDTFLYRKLVPLQTCDTESHCTIIIQLANNTLESSLPGGLAGPLRFDRFVTRSFSFDIALVGSEYVEISFIGHPDIGVSLEELEDAFHTALRGTLENGLTQETFDRVASRLSGQFESALRSDRAGYNRDLILGQLISARPIFSLEDQMSSIEDIHLEDVNEFLKSLLVEGREVTRLVSAGR